MPRQNFRPLSGRVDELLIDSEALKGNLLGDPTTRRVAVYLPAATTSDGRFPLIVYLAAFTNSGLGKVGWRLFGESIPQRIERLIEEGRMPPVVVAFPDCFTSLGGNQYINSLALGRWEDFLLEEMIPALERLLPLRPGAGHRAVVGFSSGGYGALVQALRHGGQWAAAACHSPDVGFDLVLAPSFPHVLGRLSAHGGDIRSFLHSFEEAPKVKDDDLHCLMMLAMAASYDPDPGSFKGIRLPVDLRSCSFDPERWRRWLAHDPLQIVKSPEALASLRRLKLLYLDCGSRDQYHLQYGCRQLVENLTQNQVAHVYEEYEDNHSKVEYRLDVSLPLLAENL